MIKKDISVRNSFINWDPQLSKIDYLHPLTYSCSNIIDALLPLSSFERFLLGALAFVPLFCVEIVILPLFFFDFVNLPL